MILVRQLAGYLFVPVLVVDTTGTVVFYNEPAERILGVRFEETGLVIALQQRRPAHARRWLLGRGDRVRLEVELTAFPILDQEERLLGAVAMFWERHHEPALGARRFPLEAEWTSGFDLAQGVDLLLHDAQYTRDEYSHVGWGHSTIHDALAFVRLAGVKHLVPFHHDPGRDDAALEAAVGAGIADLRPDFPVTPAAEGRSFDLR